MSDVYTRKIIDKIKKTGFPLELSVTSMLSKKFSNVQNNNYFFDYDEEKGRSIDIFIPSVGKTADLPLAIRIPIECKKSEKNAWVFFEKNEEPYVSLTGQIMDHGKISAGQYPSKAEIFAKDPDLFLHYTDSKGQGSIASNFSVVNPGSGDAKDTILEAISQVTKFTAFDIDQQRERIYKLFSRGTFLAITVVYFPVVIFEGKMFKGKINGDDLDLEEIDNVIVRHSIRPPHVSEKQDYFIDIIKKQKLDDLLSIIEADCDRLVKSVTKNKSAFEKDAKGLKTKFYLRKAFGALEKRF